MIRAVRDRLQAHISRQLEPAAAAATDLRQSVARARSDADNLSSLLGEAEALVTDLTEAAQAARTPFTASMTVHAAWARHPGAAAVFRAHHLPACPDCAVGADEALEEAAFGYALDLGSLLEELNALLHW